MIEVCIRLGGWWNASWCQGLFFICVPVEDRCTTVLECGCSNRGEAHVDSVDLSKRQKMRRPRIEGSSTICGESDAGDESSAAIVPRWSFCPRMHATRISYDEEGW